PARLAQAFSAGGNPVQNGVLIAASGLQSRPPRIICYSLYMQEQRPAGCRSEGCAAAVPIAAAVQTDTQAIAAFHDVSKTYIAGGQTVHALEGITLDIPAAHFLAVVGPSGCGKSTLLNLAGAMDFPTS